jgi:hypothetical protein
MADLYDITQIADADTVCYQYAESSDLGENPEEFGWTCKDGVTWSRLSPKTQAFVISAPHVHLEEITSSNIDEWLYRLDSLYDAGLGFLTTTSPEGEVPLRLRAQDVADHIGLRLTITPWDTPRFERHIRSLRMSQLNRRPYE